MPKRTPEEQEQAGTRVGETRVAYYAEPAKYDARANYAHVTLSSKNQITLPVAMVRMLGLQPGEELTLTQLNGKVLLSRRLYGQQQMDSIAGSIRAPEWDTKEKIDDWLRIVREGGELP